MPRLRTERPFSVALVHLRHAQPAATGRTQIGMAESMKAPPWPAIKQMRARLGGVNRQVGGIGCWPGMEPDQGVNMLRLLVDRPGSVEHEYRGERLLIAPRWVKGKETPAGIVIAPAVQPKRASHESAALVVYDIVVGEWESYVDAIDAGIAAAEAFVDSHWGEE